MFKIYRLPKCQALSIAMTQLLFCFSLPVAGSEVEAFAKIRCPYQCRVFDDDSCRKNHIGSIDDARGEPAEAFFTDTKAEHRV